MTYIAQYEMPLNERTRSFLRLQQLFERLDHTISGDNHWDVHAAVMLLLDLFDLSSRSDLKRETIKELERQTLSMREPGREWISQYIDIEKAHTDKRALIDCLHEQRGQANQQLKISEFLTSIRQRSAASTTLCTYDLTAYHHWLQQSVSRNQEKLVEWLQPYLPIRNAINNILESIRACTKTSTEMAEDGFYQRSLDSNTPLQLIQLRLHDYPDLYPEISGGKLRVSVRFMEFISPDTKAVQTHQNIQFQLSLCQI